MLTEHVGKETKSNWISANDEDALKAIVHVDRFRLLHRSSFVENGDSSFRKFKKAFFLSKSESFIFFWLFFHVISPENTVACRRDLILMFVTNFACDAVFFRILYYDQSNKWFFHSNFLSSITLFIRCNIDKHM